MLLEQKIYKIKIERLDGKIYLVLCGNYQQFNDFCRQILLDFEKGDMKYNACDFVYYRDSLCVYGYVFDDLVGYGTYFSRDDIEWGVILPRVKRKWVSDENQPLTNNHLSIIVG